MEAHAAIHIRRPMAHATNLNCIEHQEGLQLIHEENIVIGKNANRG